jgi:hypothetical protein
VSRAVTTHGHGGLDVLRLEGIPDPTASAGRAVVRIKAVALNTSASGSRGLAGANGPRADRPSRITDPESRRQTRNHSHSSLERNAQDAVHRARGPRRADTGLRAGDLDR